MNGLERSFGVAGATALVTGASGGIGLAIAEALCAAGARVAGNKAISLYAATQAALMRLARNVRGVRANAIAPGLNDTRGRPRSFPIVGRRRARWI